MNEPDGVIAYPGHTSDMAGKGRDEMRDHTGGDSGIGRAVAVAFAKEGADVAIAYLEEHDDAAHTASLVDQARRRGAQFRGDLGGLDILVNDVAYHTPLDRAAQPDEIAPWYVFFAAGQFSSYHSGEVLAPIGGETLPG